MPPKLKILVVDDDEVARAALQRVIFGLGHDCRCAVDGLDALYLHQKDPVDVIVSDWEMPNLDGVGLCEATRIVDNERYYVYFIFLTGFDTKECFLRGMEVGADDYLTKPVDVDELQARLISAARVVALNRRLADANDVLRRDSLASFNLARLDALTGVANRLRLEEDLSAVWAQAQRYGHPYSAVLCDIDWFKAYNDHFGHLAGDTALRSVALSMASQLRQCDKLYRYGGEEFVVLLPETTLAEATLVAERLCRAVSDLALRSVAAEPGVVTISAGVAQLSLGLDESSADWLARADAALYSAKESGRNRVECDSTQPSGRGTLEIRP